MHRVSSMDIEEIERELVEEDLQSNYAPGNQVKQGILKHNDVERISP